MLENYLIIVPVETVVILAKLIHDVALNINPESRFKIGRSETII